MRRGAAAAIAVLIGCSGPHPSDDGETVLRVSAVSGLSRFAPGLDVSGSSAAAMDLVYDDVVRHIESMRADGARIILSRRPSSPYSAERLATALRTTDLVSARALDARTIEARVASEKTASLVVQYEAAGFDLGPFEVAAQDARHIRLVRRDEGPIDAIEVVASTPSDEWRKLLAHELDVIPRAASVHRNQFTGVASVRVVDIPPGETAALWFNVRAPSLASADVRRQIAGIIHRDAIARVVCGDPTCASPDLPAPPATTPLPSRLAVMVPDITTLRTAAKILRHQLLSIGTELDIEPVSIAVFVDRMTRGDYVLALGPLAKAEYSFSFGFLLSPGHPKALPMTGFANAEYDAAVDRGDLRTAQAILDREVPVTRLFELRSFAAIDSAFCGDVTPSSGSWLWLAQLYPCEEGPEP